MAPNLLQRRIEQARCEARDDWNPLTDELRPLIVSSVETLLPKTCVPATFIPKIRHKLSWDIMFICLEFHYRSLVTPPFQLPCLDPWYAVGHFRAAGMARRFRIGGTDRSAVAG